MAFVCVLAALFSGIAHAQSFPSKEVRFINGFPAGGTSDIIGRLLAEQLSKRLGKTVVVDNKEELDKEIAADRLKWGRVNRGFNIKPEN